MGLALMSLYPELSDGVRVVLALIGGALTFVALATWLWQWCQYWFGEVKRAPALAIVRKPDWPRPIELIDLARIAETKHGWRIRELGSFHEEDFRNALRQAASDGDLLIKGRHGNPQHVERLAASYPLLPIPKEHFADFHIEAPGYFSTDTRNFFIRTRSYQWDHSDAGYCDLIVADEASALDWLETRAVDFKGKAAAAHRQHAKDSERWMADMRERGLVYRGDPDSEQGGEWVG
jgi:hypothetical protein